MAVSKEEQKAIDEANEKEYQKSLKKEAKTGDEFAATPSEPNLLDAKFATKHESSQKTEKVKEDSHEKKDEEREKAVKKGERAPIESVAQLRDEAATLGKNTNAAQVEKAKEVEAKIAEEGAKETRLASAVADKPK